MPKPASLFRYQAIGHTGPQPASIAFRQGRKQAVIFYDPDLKVPARNPSPTDSLGRVNLYMPAGEAYEVTVHFGDGSTDQFIHTAIQMGTAEIVVKETPIETVREVIKEVPGPERVVYKDRIEYVQVKPDLAKLQAAADALRKAKREADASKPKRLPGDMFDLSDMSDFLRESEPHAESQDRFRRDYIQLTSRLVDPRVTPLSDAERVYQRRLQAALYSGRGGAVEII